MRLPPAGVHASTLSDQGPPDAVGVQIDRSCRARDAERASTPSWILGLRSATSISSFRFGGQAGILAVPFKSAAPFVRRQGELLAFSSRLSTEADVLLVQRGRDARHGRPFPSVGQSEVSPPVRPPRRYGRVDPAHRLLELLWIEAVVPSTPFRPLVASTTTRAVREGRSACRGRTCRWLWCRIGRASFSGR